MKKKLSLLLFSYLVCTTIFAQQIADTSYKPHIEQPEYAPNSGPIVFIDEGHHNFHTKEGRYKAFALLLERDGYRVQAYTGSFTAEKLSQGDILVISNALNKQNVEDWFLPNPSAFTPAEIAIVKEWVAQGGKLFLIADHMPLAGAAEDLAAAFGYKFTNGFAMDTAQRGPTYFERNEGTLKACEITNGRTDDEQVNHIASFTGQAFKAPKNAQVILQLPKGHINLLPDTAWKFNQNTLMHDVSGWTQGAYQNFDKGKIVVFGEAAMFSAQLVGPKQFKAGMGRADASENYQLLLNIIHWLDKGD